MSSEDSASSSESEDEIRTVQRRTPSFSSKSASTTTTTTTTPPSSTTIDLTGNHKSAARASHTISDRYPIALPASITGETLYTLARLTPGGVNPVWTSPISGKTGQGSTNLHKHVEKLIAKATDKKITDYAKALQMSKEKHKRPTRKSKAQKLESSAASSSRVPSTSSAGVAMTVPQAPEARAKFAETPIGKALSVGWIGRARTAVSTYVIQDAMPLSTPGSSAFQDFVDEILLIGRNTPSNLRASDLLQDRKSFTATTDALCEHFVAQMHEGILPTAQQYGATLSQDGRSNIRHDPLIATIVETAAGFVPLGTVNAGSEKKDIAFVVELIKRYCDSTDVGANFAPHIIAVVLDGAPVNISALKLVEEELSLVPVRCQSHAVALLIKHVINDVFSETIAEAEAMIKFVRRTGRVHALFRSLTGLVLFRCIPIRFATHTIACNRLIRTKNKGLALFGNEEYSKWLQSANPSKREEADQFLTSWKDDRLWYRLEFLVAVTLPLVNALRLMDTSKVRAKHVFKIWEKLGVHLAGVLKDSKWSSINKSEKKEIFELYLAAMDNACYPIVYAAYALDPTNLAEVRQLAASRDDEDAVAWETILEHTKHVLATVIRRQYRESFVSFVH